MKTLKNTVKFVIKWLGNAELLSAPRSYVEKALSYYYSSKGKVICNFANSRDDENARAIDLIAQIKRETEMLLADQEAYLIYTTVRKADKIEGDVAEVGVYMGGSAKLICEATEKPLHLFDTFEGLPDLSEHDNAEQFHKGDYCAVFENVRTYLRSYPNVFFHRGPFPSTAEPEKNTRFAFAHLDVDIYESTLSCLKFFYPRMSKGGVIMSHDYRSRGVKKAFDEFFEDKPEIILEPFGTEQCLVIKV